jgi:hypothetical protein
MLYLLIYRYFCLFQNLFQLLPDSCTMYNYKMYIHCYSIYLRSPLSSGIVCTKECRQKNLIKTAKKYEREHRRSSLNLGIIISSYLMKILKQHCLTIAIKLRSSDQSLSNDQSVFDYQYPALQYC